MIGVCRQMQSSFTACVQMVEMSLMWRLPMCMKVRWSVGEQLSCYIALSISAITVHTRELKSLQQSCWALAHLFLTGTLSSINVLHWAGLREGRKEVVVVLRYDWCNLEESRGAADSLYCQSMASSSPYLLAPEISVLRQSCNRGHMVQLLSRGMHFWPRHIPAVRVSGVKWFRVEFLEVLCQFYILPGNKGPRKGCHAAPLWSWESVKVDQTPRTR